MSQIDVVKSQLQALFADTPFQLGEITCITMGETLYISLELEVAVAALIRKMGGLQVMASEPKVRTTTQAIPVEAPERVVGVPPLTEVLLEQFYTFDEEE